MHKPAFVWSALAAVLPAMAQPAAAPPVAPAETTVPPPPAYRSAFADYRPWREPNLLSWRAANEEAGSLGGHMGQVRGHARGGAERMQDGTATNAPPSAKPGPAR